MGERQDARAHLARGRAARVGRRGRAARRSARSRWASGAPRARAGSARRAAPRCSRWRSPGACSSPTSLQYHGSNLAPTARYEELAAVDSRFAGQRAGAVHRLRRILAVRAAPPRRRRARLRLPARPRSQRLAGGYGHPVDLDRRPPRALVSYPLIVTRRDPDRRAAAGGLRARLAGPLLRGVAHGARAPGPALVHAPAGERDAGCLRARRSDSR